MGGAGVGEGGRGGHVYSASVQGQVHPLCPPAQMHVLNPPKNHAHTDAYERLILDCINGDRRLFIRNDELEVAWQKITPLLRWVSGRCCIFRVQSEAPWTRVCISTSQRLQPLAPPTPHGPPSTLPAHARPSPPLPRVRPPHTVLPKSTHLRRLTYPCTKLNATTHHPGAARLRSVACSQNCTPMVAAALWARTTWLPSMAYAGVTCFRTTTSEDQALRPAREAPPPISSKFSCSASLHCA